MNQYCKYCDKRLVRIGRDRLNGANHSDWTTRDCHKSCLKQNQSIDEVINVLKEANLYGVDILEFISYKPLGYTKRK
jgi:hypothetical protein